MYILQIALCSVIVAAFAAAAVLANEKSAQVQAAAKARGLTSHGRGVFEAEGWLFVTVLALSVDCILVWASWVRVKTYDPPFWLMAGSLALNVIIVFGASQFSMWRWRQITNPKPPKKDPSTPPE